jgi:hypothetical protein
VTNPYGENPYTQQSPHAPTIATPPFQAAGPLYGAPPREHPQGTLILIFGIIGIFVTIFAPIAWYLGSKARREIMASGVQYSNEPNVNAGRILGMVFSIVWLVFVGIMILGFAVPAIFVLLASASSLG